jgi:hypothetical protein
MRWTTSLLSRQEAANMQTGLWKRPRNSPGYVEQNTHAMEGEEESLILSYHHHYHQIPAARRNESITIIFKLFIQSF